MNMKDFNNSAFRAVEKVVDEFLSQISRDIDPVTLDIIYDKYHALGASLVEVAYLLTRNTVSQRPWLPEELVCRIVRAINHVGITEECASIRNS